MLHRCNLDPFAIHSVERKHGFTPTVRLMNKPMAYRHFTKEEGEAAQLWANDNCKGRVAVTHVGGYFEYEADAALFVLVWGSK